MGKRISHIDLASGIMIVWLLYYHALYPMLGYDIFIKLPWLFFFMPWFFYKSGNLFNSRDERQLLKGDIKKLIGNFIIWSLVGYICFIIHTLVIDHSITFRQAVYSPIRSLILAGSIPLNSALWFLPVLFFVRQIANIAVPRLKIIYICIVSVAIAIVIHFMQFKYLPLYIYNTAWGLFFFCSGFALKGYEEKPALIAISLLIVSFAIYYTDIPSVYKCEDFISGKSYTLWFPVSVCGCIIYNNVCKCIDDWVIPYSILKYIGRHSMVFYAAHYPIFRIVFDYVARYNSSWYGSWQGLLIITIAYIGIIFPLTWFIDIVKLRYHAK